MELCASFTELNLVEQQDCNGGGLLSAVAGGLAGAVIGAYIGLIPTLVTGDASYIGKAVITGTTVGIWAGLGCPLP